MEQLGGFCCFETHKVLPFRVNEVIFLLAEALMKPWKKARKSWNPKPTKKGELKHGTGTYKNFCWKDSRMFRSCIVIMVRFVVEIFLVLMNQWSLDDFYVYVSIGTCLLENLSTCFDHQLFFRGQREHGTSSCEQRGAPPSNQATGPNRETSTPLAVLTWWMTTSFEFFFGFLKGKLASKPWTCLFSRLSLDLSRFGGWTIARVFYFPTGTTRITRTYCGVTTLPIMLLFTSSVVMSQNEGHQKKPGDKMQKKITSNQSFQSCLSTFLQNKRKLFVFWGGDGGGGMEGVVFSGVLFFLGCWRSSFHQVKRLQLASDHALTSKWPKIPLPSPSPKKKTPRLLVEGFSSLDSRLIYLSWILIVSFFHGFRYENNHDLNG